MRIHPLAVPALLALLTLEARAQGVAPASAAPPSPAPAASSAPSAPPTVHVIGTGGTIGSSGNYWMGQPTRIPIEQLVRVPGIDTVGTVSTEQLWNIGSGAVGPARWLELSRHVSATLAQRPELSGVIVTHGTDTMEETAYFLDLTVGDPRPVVVTGAMRPADMAGADGPANLSAAARAVRDPRSRGRGTMVLMNDRLFAARDVTKSNTIRVDTFEAPDRGPVALVDPEALHFRQPSPNRTAPAFDIAGLTTLPRVDIVYAYPGSDGTAVDAFVAAGARGIVVAGMGRGGVTAEMQAAMRRASERGTIVVRGSRTGAGSVPSRSPGIGTGELNPQKARVLLMLALTRTSDPKEITRLFAAQ